MMLTFFRVIFQANASLIFDVTSINPSNEMKSYHKNKAYTHAHTIIFIEAYNLVNARKSANTRKLLKIVDALFVRCLYG